VVVGLNGGTLCGSVFPVKVTQVKSWKLNGACAFACLG
jgi:hypothetical protein